MGTRNEYQPESISPPGHTLLDILEEQEMTQKELAKRMGRPVKTINEIVKGKTAITAETALQLERVLSIPSNFWNRRESRYREYLARAQENDRLAKQIEWLKKFPRREMIKLGLIRDTKDKLQQLKDMLSFFGVASPDEWDSFCREPQASYRRSSKFDGNEGAVSAWLRQGEIEGQKIHTQAFDKEKFRCALQEIRNMTTATPKEIQTKVVEHCAKAGVAVVFVPRPKGVPVSGATRWLTSEKALILLSLRFKTDDHLWFSFFHEAGHIMLHGKKDIYIDTDKCEGPKEDEANAFASNMLIPPAAQRRLEKMDDFSDKEIVAFSDEIGIAPGIVVGRLQHDGRIPWNTRLHKLKRKFDWQKSV